MIFLTFIAAIFHKIAAAIAVLQFDAINFGDAAGSTTHHLLACHVIGAHQKCCFVQYKKIPLL
jgi:hypothetical protein